MAAWAGPGDDTDEEIRLCRIEYLGDDDWGFALYDPATETYEPAVPAASPSAAPSRPTTTPPLSTSCSNLAGAFTARRSRCGHAPGRLLFSPRPDRARRAGGRTCDAASNTMALVEEAAGGEGYRRQTSSPSPRATSKADINIIVCLSGRITP